MWTELSPVLLLLSELGGAAVEKLTTSLQLFEGPQKNTCKHDIFVLFVGEHFRGESVKQCSNNVHKKTLSSCVVLGVPLTSEAKYFQETLTWLPRR